MSLITTYTNDIAGAQAKLADTKRRQLTQQYQSNRQAYETDMKFLWSDDSAAGGLSVVQKFGAFGSDAATLFALAAATAQFLMALDPTYTPSTPSTYGWTQATSGTTSLTYIINQDGTVTINP